MEFIAILLNQTSHHGFHMEQSTPTQPSASFLSDAVSLAWQAIPLLLVLLSGIILGPVF